MRTNKDIERIVKFNSQLGLKTEFIDDSNDVLGYSLGNVIYINVSIEQDYDKINKHEILHFYTDTIEFQYLKEYLFKKYKDKIEKYRDEYFLRYFGLYTLDDIKNGIIDDEIAIDLMIDNFSIILDGTLRVGDLLFNSIKQDLKYKRYLSLNINNNIDNMNLSKWEKIFVVNYYNGKEHKMPSHDKYNKIKKDIELELNRLYSLVKNKDFFTINSNSKEIVRKFENEIKKLIQKGEKIEEFLRRKEDYLRELAEKFSEYLYEEYKNIVDCIKRTEYENAFKLMILRETLLKIYIRNKENGKSITMIKKRILNNSISSHLVINDLILDVLYKNIDNYDNFANLYFSALEIFDSMMDFNTVKLDNIKTYGMGTWVKFDGKQSDEVNYLENANKLVLLIKYTTWCTKTLANYHLSEGDFYVFVDNFNKPHIAVKMKGNMIDEVRGILDELNQELEPEYRKVAISFLEQNNMIENSQEWLEREKWNERLIGYIEKIDNGFFGKKDISFLIDDYFKKKYKNHGFSDNLNKVNLKNRFYLIKDKFAQYFNCEEEEIYFGNLEVVSDDIPYTVVLGDVKFCCSEVKKLGNLKVIGGSVNFGGSKVESLGNLEMIFGDVKFKNSEVTDLGSLKVIYGKADFEGAKITNLGNLEIIFGDVEFYSSKVESLGLLQKIGGNADFDGSKLVSLGLLQKIGGNADFDGSKVVSLGLLQKIGGNADFDGSKVVSLGLLQKIGGNADFDGSKVVSLGLLQKIGGNANFRGSNVTDLGCLQTIGGNADFGGSNVVSLGRLKIIGGDACFYGSKVVSLCCLEKINGKANFVGSEIMDLGNLETIGGDACFNDSKIDSLNSLRIVGGDVYFDNIKEFNFNNVLVLGCVYFYDHLARKQLVRSK